MKKTILQNTEISKEIAAIGHTQSILVSDLGLPVPKGVKCIDLAVSKGVPTFEQVLDAVFSEMKVESIIVAAELKNLSLSYVDNIAQKSGAQDVIIVPHDELKKLSENCNCIIRTGEGTPYRNVILISGVDF